jgi:uncharacterized damage-inducible protein DinB
MTVEQTFLRCSAERLRQSMSRIEACLAKLSEEQIWMRAGENSNAAGNLCLHLAGNVRQWILHGVGGVPDVRTRDAEFDARGGTTPAELSARLRSTVDEACAVIEALPEARVLDRQTTQNYECSVLEAIYHVVEHFSLHTGQIILLTKAYSGEDLGFYAHLRGSASSSEGPQAGDTQP